jgi:hypothetical protein
MNILDWLATPMGVEAFHAVIALVTALAAYLSYLAHRGSRAANQKLDDHIADVSSLMYEAPTAQDPPPTLSEPPPRG